jgi:hypothetical protein
MEFDVGEGRVYLIQVVLNDYVGNMHLIIYQKAQSKFENI